MDKRTIYSKTGKGSLEISKKTIKLASDERQTLILVDGKSNIGEIEEKLSRISPVRLRAIMDRLTELDLIREFVTKQGPDSIMPSLNGSSAMKVEEIGEEDLDFTALVPAASGNTVKEVEERREAALRAEEEARVAREAAAKAAAEAEAIRRIEEEARRKVEEEYRLKAEEEARRKAEDEARRRGEEEARRKIEEEARRKVEEEARHKAEEEARRKAEEDARRKAEEEARRRAEEEARRKAEEESRRKTEEEARRRAEEEARRKAEEEARRKAEDEARRRAEEEARQKAEEAARRRAEEEARAKAEQEARRRLDEEQRQREEAERRAAAEAEARERARREEEARRAAIADEKRRREEAEAIAAEQSRRDEAARQEAERRAAFDAEARERTRRDEEARHSSPGEPQPQIGSSSDHDNDRAAAEAARYTAALTPHLEEAAAAEPASVDLDFGSSATPLTGGIESMDLKPLAGGGPDTFADTGMSASSRFESDLAEDDASEVKSKKDVEKESRRELEREAKENAKAGAKAKKDAEREAKRLAKESHVKVRRSGGLSVGKIIGIFVVLMIVCGIGYLYFMPIDKSLVESQATARFGVQVKVGSAKFSPFPPQLTLSNVVFDDISLPRVVAVPDPGSLAADRKIWKSIDVAGAQISVAQAKKLIAIGLQEPPKGVAMTVQRVRVTGLTVTDSPVPLPAFDATMLFANDATVKQANFVTADNKGQLQLSIDEKGWLVDFESHGLTWALGPKTPWESVRAKGLAGNDGIKFESIAITHFAGNANGRGELTWKGNWKFSGSMEIGGMETGSIAQAYYNATPVSGTIDGKFSVNMASAALTGLIESTKLEGSAVINKAAIANIDLARTAQAGTLTGGKTPFSDFECDLSTDGAKVQIKNVRANSGLLNVNGDTTIAADKSLSGTINIELGISSNRTKAAMKVSGTPTDIRLSK